MQALSSYSDLLDACRTLFDSDGPSADGVQLLANLKPNLLKATFRRRIMETHPDRARQLGQGLDVLNARCRGITRAYHMLRHHLERRDSLRDVSLKRGETRRRHRQRCRTARGVRGSAERAGTATASHVWRNHRRRGAERTELDHYCVAPLPNRQLRLAEFAYRAGEISWQHFIAAVCWQRRQRPTVGQLAVDLAYLKREEVSDILALRTKDGASSVPFAEYARRLGHLTLFEQMVVVGRQRQLQRRIGEYFVESGLLASEQVDALAERLTEHNWRAAGTR